MIHASTSTNSRATAHMVFRFFSSFDLMLLRSLWATVSSESANMILGTYGVHLASGAHQHIRLVFQVVRYLIVHVQVLVHVPLGLDQLVVLGEALRLLGGLGEELVGLLLFLHGRNHLLVFLLITVQLFLVDVDLGRGGKYSSLHVGVSGRTVLDRHLAQFLLGVADRLFDGVAH